MAGTKKGKKSKKLGRAPKSKKDLLQEFGILPKNEEDEEAVEEVSEEITNEEDSLDQKETELVSENQAEDISNDENEVEKPITEDTVDIQEAPTEQLEDKEDCIKDETSEDLEEESLNEAETKEENEDSIKEESNIDIYKWAEEVYGIEVKEILPKLQEFNPALYDKFKELTDLTNSAFLECEKVKSEADELLTNAKGKDAKANEILAAAESKIQSKVDEEVKKIEKDYKAKTADYKKACDEEQKKATKLINKYTGDLKKLEVDKISYKSKISEKVLEDFKTQALEINSNLDKLQELEQKNALLEKRIEKLSADKNSLLAESSKVITLGYEKKDLEKEKEELKNDNGALAGENKKLLEANNKLEGKLKLYGDDPDGFLKKNDGLNETITKLQEALTAYKGVNLTEIEDKAGKYEQKCKDYESLNKQKIALDAEIMGYTNNNEELENTRRYVKFLEAQISELKDELDSQIKTFNKSAKLIFPTLSAIDEEVDKELKDAVPPSKVNKRLSEICNDFRAYAANRHEPLYYDINTIRTFIAGFGATRLTILEGLSGTGKSSLPMVFAEYCGAIEELVPVQASWKDRNDLLGFYNDFKKQYKETDFLKALYRASRDNKHIYLIVLDEMNISRIEYYFEDMITTLEKKVDDWDITLIPDTKGVALSDKSYPVGIHDGKLKILPNTWFVGTANKDDSTFDISDKVYDRATVIKFHEEAKSFKAESANRIHLGFDEFDDLLENAKISYSKAKLEQYMNYVSALNEQIKDLFEISYGNRVAIQLKNFIRTYVACGGTEFEAIDSMFSRKIVRKIETLYSDNLSSKIDEFKLFLDKGVYKNNMPLTIAALDRIKKNLG